MTLKQRLTKVRARLKALVGARRFRRSRTLYWRGRYHATQDPKKRGKYLTNARDSAKLGQEIGRTQGVLRRRREKVKARLAVTQGMPGNPKAVIDQVVVPIARQCGVDVTPESVAAANARHGNTVTGNRSDHQGPPSEAWAADMSNGSSPTKEMDQLARELADRFGLSWGGSGIVNAYHDGYRFQMLYRTFIGGNHQNHVHFGVRKA